MLFDKDILAPGTYHVGGGMTFEVSDADVQKYADTLTRMVSAGHRIPLNWEHPPAVEGMPVSLTKYEELAEKTRTTPGYIESVKVVDGRLRGRLNVPGKSDAEKLKSGAIRGVSPRLVPGKWTDGMGREWDHVIGHVALTNHPRDTRQGSFVPLPAELSMHGNSPFALDVAMAEDEEDAMTAEEEAGAAVDDAEKAEDAAADAETAAEAGEKSDEEAEANKESAEDLLFASVIALLREHGVALPEDTDKANFMNKLIATLSAKTQNETATADTGENTQQGSTLKVEQPMQFSSHPLFQKLVTLQREALVAKISSPQARKKLTPAAQKKLKTMATQVQLSDSGAETGNLTLSQVVDLMLETGADLSSLTDQDGRAAGVTVEDLSTPVDTEDKKSDDKIVDEMTKREKSGGYDKPKESQSLMRE